MTTLELFRDHIASLQALAEEALRVSSAAGQGSEGIVLHAGSATRYHADDQAVPFRTTPHFARFAPIAGPDHLVVVRPGGYVRLACVTPTDYWEEPPEWPEHPFGEVLDVVEAPEVLGAGTLLGDVSGCAYVGNAPELAVRLGIAVTAVEPRALMDALDWHRAFKTPYEVACIREANRIAARGHLAARAGFVDRRSERAIHADYLEATGALDSETPYPNIMAWDDRASVLHYQRKRAASPDPGNNFLIDAGASVYGYASDVTRSYARADAHPAFREALDRIEALQQEIAGRVRPGGSYVDLHARAVSGLARILCDLGVLTVGVDEALEKSLVLPFLPHGLGHHLGLQVHDVGGHQIGPEGGQQAPPEAHPYLRTTRGLEAGHVVTVEPGLYFIPQLLEPHRSGPNSSAFDWGLVDALIPCGGMRIEDDVLVTESGYENLTRPFLPGHRGEPEHVD